MRGWTRWIGTPRALARRLAFATAVGVFLGVIGPFGSFGAPFAARVVSWTVSLWLGSLFAAVTLNGAEAVRDRTDLPAWFAWPAALVVASAPTAGAAAAVFSALSLRPPDLSPLEWYLQTLAIAAPSALGYLLVMRLAERAAASTLPAALSRPGPAGPPFLNRVPARLGRDLLALQMEDHYVRAHTTRGSALVLLPLARAVEELGGVEGLRVHRSWWVARAAVEDVEEDGRNLRLRLRGDLKAPVARGAVAGLREAGWLPPPRALRRDDSPESES